MLQLPRSLIQQVRAVFRRLARRSVLRPQVAFHADDGGLRVRLHHAEAAAEFHQPGSYSSEVIALPLDALADFEGRADTLVSLEPVKGGKVLAQWQDGVVPRVTEYEATRLKDLPAFPELPKEMVPAKNGFLKTLTDAVRAAARDGIRYALDKIQLRGRTGEIVTADGRQLLVQSGFSFPWTEDVLVPAVPVFHSGELAVHEPVSIGKTDTHVALQAGPWTLHLPIDREGRFPKTEDVIPKAERIESRCRIVPEDGHFLDQTLPRLPGGDEDNSPITVELNGQVVVRAKASEQKRTTELLLNRSQSTGKPVRLHTNREFLHRAMRLGFTEIAFVNADSPVLCQDDRRTYVWMPLGQQGALPPSKDAIRVASDSHDQPTNSRPTHRRKPTMSTTQETGNNPPASDNPAQPKANGRPRRKAKNTGVSALIEEAESLKNLLRDAYGRANQLVGAIRRHRKQSQLVQSTLKSLRELQTVDA